MLNESQLASLPIAHKKEDLIFLAFQMTCPKYTVINVRQCDSVPMLTLAPMMAGPFLPSCYWSFLPTQ